MTDANSAMSTAMVNCILLSFPRSLTRCVKTTDWTDGKSFIVMGKITFLGLFGQRNAVLLTYFNLL